jgi:hypothetical protein
MRIAVRGWGRNQGEKEIMNAELRNAEAPPGSYSMGKTYLRVEYPNSRIAKARISTSTELRLGGRYLLHVELSRKEIAQLFYETHSGDIVRMFRSFIEDEEREEKQERLKRLRQWSTQEKQAE